LIQLDTSAEEAQLHSAEADLSLARADVERSRDLAARRVIFESGPGCGRIKIQSAERSGRPDAFQHSEKNGGGTIRWPTWNFVT